MLNASRLSFQRFVFYFLPLSFCVLPFAFCFSGCQDSEYAQMVKREQARNIRMDSIFLGLKFGDSKKDFFDKCRKLNLEGITEDGSNAGLNVQVLRKIDSTLTDAKVNMYFYPNFNEKYQIIEMPVHYSYNSYFPYVERYHSKVLMPQVLKLLEHDYGKFIPVFKPGKDTIYVHIDANRRITVNKKDDQFVLAKFTDLTAVK